MGAGSVSSEKIVLKQKWLNLQVIANQEEYDATGRTKDKQKMLLAFSILLTIGGFFISIIGMRAICQYARSAAGSVVAHVPEGVSHTGQMVGRQSHGAKCDTKPVDEDTQAAAETSDHGNHTASKIDIADTHENGK